MLAEMNFYGNYSLPRNFSTALNRYHQLATLNGNASAQHMLGFMYATGIGGAVEQDQAKALLYYTFAAEGGDIKAEMAVAYRYHAGISTPRNCDEAVHYYRKVADKAIEYIRSGPPGGHMIVKDSYRIADDDGGVYGEGASVSSSGLNAKNGAVHSDAHASFEDVIEYLDLMSRKGDLKATFSLAKLHYDGSRGTQRDLRRARQYFLEVARIVWPKKGTERQDIPQITEKLASKSAGFLGRMFLRGEGVKQDFELAQIWFRRGIKYGDALSQYSMGIMHLYGLGVPQDSFAAAEKFLPAADQDLASAQVRLGVLFLDQGETTTAIQYFDHAARNGHIEAYYYLAELSYQGIGRDQSCPVAAAYYKIVSEKAEIILASFKEANEAYKGGDVETALIDYLLAAEQGFEAAQANVAYMLDRALPHFNILTLGSSLLSSSGHAALTSKIATNPTLALTHWTRSARQSNIDSLLKMGDYYLHGLGTPHNIPDREKSASCYQAAAETLHSAQAYWNLGWMHENGLGMGQDFHLAKRFYDLALETGRGEAYLPVKLALMKLRWRSALNRWFGASGGVRSIEDEKRTWSLSHLSRRGCCFDMRL
jgi:SEL1 protein